jgi:hypothetical protein
VLLVDTDVMIDILRGHPPALDWMRSHSPDTGLGLPGFVVLEMLSGCENKRQSLRIRRLVRSYRVCWPTHSDCERALAHFADRHLRHGLGILDALIAECAVGLAATLLTFNRKHFAAVPRLKIEQPYRR